MATSADSPSPAEKQRKAGGVFYTPAFIVDSILDSTLGRLLANKQPEDIGELRVLDMACGDGAFLIGAYRYLLNWYGERSGAGHDGRSGPNADERLAILRRHIFGVDIDANALEVAKHALLELAAGKEPENARREAGYRADFLDQNIKHGNAIIAPGIFEYGTIDPDTRNRIRPFDWEGAFRRGASESAKPGFDVIVGNPPYVQLSARDYSHGAVNRYLTDTYGSSMGRRNAFGYFVEKALRDLLREGGYLGLVLPNTILTQASYGDLRRMMLSGTITEITTYSKPVFKDAVVETVDIVLRASRPVDAEIRLCRRDGRGKLISTRHVPQLAYDRDEQAAFLVHVGRTSLELGRRIARAHTPLGELVHVNQAIALKGNRAASLFDHKGASNFVPVLDGREVSRYGIKWSGRYLEYERARIHSCKRRDIFESPEKIFVRRVGERIIAALDREGFYALNTLLVLNLKPGAAVGLPFLLAILNSGFSDFYIRTFLKSDKKVFSEIQARQLARLPIPVPTSPSEIETARRISSLAEDRLKAPDDVVHGLETELDDHIMDLYGLNPDERALIQRPDSHS